MDIVAAAANNDLPQVIDAINHGVPIDLHNPTGDTALLWAAMNRNPVIAQYLLEHGANPNTTGSRGVTPLIVAVMRNDPTMIEMLLRQGADPLIRDQSGHDALYYAKNADDRWRTIQLYHLYASRRFQLMKRPQENWFPLEFYDVPYSEREYLVDDLVEPEIERSKQETALWNHKTQQEWIKQSIEERNNKTIPPYLEFLVPFHANALDGQSNDTLAFSIRDHLAPHIHAYYAVLARLLELGSGSYGSTFTTSMVTTELHLEMVRCCWGQLNGHHNTPCFTEGGPLVLKATSIMEADPTILYELSLYRDRYGWFYPRYYGSWIQRQGAPVFWDPKHNIGDAEAKRLATGVYDPDNETSSLLLFERIHGKPLNRILGEFSEADKQVLQFVIYSALHSMYHTIGFVHGDLGAHNILVVKGPCRLPIYDKHGFILGTVLSNWRPVLIDMGMAMTKAHPRWSDFVNPSVGVERDWMMVHVAFHPEGSPLMTQWSITTGVECNYHNLIGSVAYDWTVSYDQMLGTLNQDVRRLQKSKIVSYPSSSPSYTSLENPRILWTELLPMLLQISKQLKRSIESSHPEIYSYLSAMIAYYQPELKVLSRR